MAPSDVEVLKRQDVRDALDAAFVETSHQGLKGPAWDGVAVAREPSVRLDEIEPDVFIWHGEADRNDPVAMARHQESRISRVEATYYPDEGHLIFFSRADEIFSVLVGADLDAKEGSGREVPK